MPGIASSPRPSTSRRTASPSRAPTGGPWTSGQRTLRSEFFVPFEAAVREAHVGSAMAAYNEIDGIPGHVNGWLLRHVLRDEWKFGGLIVSDGWGIPRLVTVHHVASTPAEAARRALAAGIRVRDWRRLPDAPGRGPGGARAHGGPRPGRAAGPGDQDRSRPVRSRAPRRGRRRARQQRPRAPGAGAPGRARGGRPPEERRSAPPRQGPAQARRDPRPERGEGSPRQLQRRSRTRGVAPRRRARGGR